MYICIYVGTNINGIWSLFSWFVYLINCNLQGLQYDNKGKGAREYGFYPMPDLEKLLVILTIDNAQMLRINPKLLETNESLDNQSPGAQIDRAALHNIQVKKYIIIFSSHFCKLFHYTLMRFVFLYEYISAHKCWEPRRFTFESKQHYQYCKVGYKWHIFNE